MLNSRTAARHIRNQPRFNLASQRKTPAGKIRIPPLITEQQFPQRKTWFLPDLISKLGLNSAKSLVEADGIEPTT